MEGSIPDKTSQGNRGPRPLHVSAPDRVRPPSDSSAAISPLLNIFLDASSPEHDTSSSIKIRSHGWRIDSWEYRRQKESGSHREGEGWIWEGGCWTCWRAGEGRPLLVGSKGKGGQPNSKSISRRRIMRKMKTHIRWGRVCVLLRSSPIFPFLDIIPPLPGTRYVVLGQKSSPRMAQRLAGIASGKGEPLLEGERDGSRSREEDVGHAGWRESRWLRSTGGGQSKSRTLATEE